MLTRNNKNAIPHDKVVVLDLRIIKTRRINSSQSVIYVIIKPQKDKGKALKKHILEENVLRGLDVRIEEIQEKHQQSIKENCIAQ